MKKIPLYLLALLFMLSFSYCKQEAFRNNEFRFESIDPSHSGIDFSNSLSDDPFSDRNVLSYEYYYNGAGVALVDINNDGLTDVFFAGNEVPNKLYLNKGEFKFEDISEQANINENKHWASGVTIVDINGDGFNDIYVCQQGPYTDPDMRRNLLYINNGDLSFSEHAKEYGLDDGNLSTQAVFFDYDQDGDLDCYVMNESKYVRVQHSIIFEEIKEKSNLLAASGHLYRNNGKNFFEQVTEEAGMLKLGFGLGLVVSDFNNDNWPDVYVANDYFIPDFMFINQKDGTFKESIAEYTKQVSFFGMGCDAADINNDGLVDISVVDMSAQDHYRSKTLMESMNVANFWYYINFLHFHYQYMFNSLQLNNGDGTFSNIANFANVASSDWSWATILTDVDLDGYKDMFVTNGYRRYARDNDFRIEMQRIRDENGGSVPMEMREELYNKMPEVQLPNKLYLNNRNLKYIDKAEELGLEASTYSYGAAFGDLDNDGDLDLVVNNTDQKAMLWKSNASDLSNFLKLKLEYPLSPNTRFCSKVKVFYPGGEQMQEYQFVRGYESTQEEGLVFGLANEGNIDSIVIRWSDGNVQKLENVAVNESITIKYEKGRAFKNSNEGIIASALFKEKDPVELGVFYYHKEDGYDDFARETLLPHKQSTLGPALAAADINKDGLTDFYIGGAKGSAGALYIQNREGDFTIMTGQPWDADILSEDVDAMFLDVNNDGWDDLFVLSGGGGEMLGEKEILQDRFYANVKGERFVKIGNALPDQFSVSSGIESLDFDNDGDQDLFIGGGSKPGNYPVHEPSVLLRNDKNVYKDVSSGVFPEDLDLGIVKACLATDVNNDGKEDLIVVGEWTNINVLINHGGNFIDESAQYGVDSLLGWWYSILDIDYDGDGDMDYIIGNMSENYKHHVSKEKPLYLFYNDFDENGLGDIVLSKKYHGELVPARGKECSTGQMPFLAEKVKTYDQFATSNIYEIYGDEMVRNSIELQANSFKSVVLINEKDHFSIRELPIEAQLFPVLDLEKADLDGDEKEDIILIGNVFNTEVETPRIDAGNGLILLNKGKGQFRSLKIRESGFKTPFNAKKMALLYTAKGMTIVVANNDAKPQFFELVSER